MARATRMARAMRGWPARGRSRVLGGVAAAVVIVSLAGCSDAGDGYPAESTESAPVTAATSEGDLSGAAAPSQGSGVETTEAPSDPAPSGAHGDDGTSSLPPVTRDDLLDALWEIADLEGERPDVPLIREVDDDEWMTVHVECMTGMGFPPTTNNDHAVGWEAPAGQADAFALAQFTCEAQYPRLMAYQQPYTTDQLTLIYDWMIHQTIPCLAAEGYQVADVVSLETFIAGYSPQGGFWTPADGVPGGVPYATQEVCSHMPPQETLYGG